MFCLCPQYMYTITSHKVNFEHTDAISVFPLTIQFLNLSLPQRGHFVTSYSQRCLVFVSVSHTVMASYTYLQASLSCLLLCKEAMNPLSMRSQISINVTLSYLLCVLCCVGRCARHSTTFRTHYVLNLINIYYIISYALIYLNLLCCECNAYVVLIHMNLSIWTHYDLNVMYICYIKSYDLIYLLILINIAYQQFMYIRKG